MIKNERQYRITQSWVEKCRTALEEFEKSPQSSSAHPKLRKVQIDAMHSQIEDLEAQLKEYHTLRSGQRKVLHVETFHDLPRTLIQARIASGMTQEELANRLGLKEQQIQKYEANDYSMASFARVAEVAEILGVHVREAVLSGVLPK